MKLNNTVLASCSYQSNSQGREEIDAYSRVSFNGQSKGMLQTGLFAETPDKMTGIDGLLFIRIKISGKRVGTEKFF